MLKRYIQNNLHYSHGNAFNCFLMRLLSDEGLLRDKVNHFGEFGEKNATDLTSMFSVMTASAALCVNAEFTWQTLHVHACEHCHCEHMACAFSLMEHWLYFY